MKNCRRKIRGVARGSLWSDDEFNQRMSRLRKLQSDKKGMNEAIPYVVTERDFEHAVDVLRDFMVMEDKFCNYLRDEKNWAHEGMNDDGEWVEHDWSPSDSDKDCGCG
jgi:hypothetical protein